MRLRRWALLLICTFALTPAFSQQTVLEKPVSVVLQEASVQAAIRTLQARTGVQFTYDSSILPASSVRLKFRDAPLKDVLVAILHPAGLDFTARRGMIIVHARTEALAPLPQFTISGYVEDGETGERLIGASVYDARTRAGTLTNQFGFFSLRLPADSVKLVISMVGYAVRAEKFALDRDVRRRVEMLPDLRLDVVEINDADVEGLDELSGVSMFHVPVSELKRLPSLMGEGDVLNALKLFPGVQSAGDGSGGLYVRGGGPDQNLILYDGVPIYNSSHLFGLFSIFNADAIKDIRLVKGGFPARYGGRLSSVIDIRMKEGNLKKIRGEGNIGLTAARLTIEGPIIRDKTSFLISARRTILEPYLLILNNRAARSDGNNLGYFFYDLNAKIHHKLSDRDRIFLSAYTGGDRFASGYDIEANGTRDKLDFGLRWGNDGAVLRWHRDWNKELFSDFSLFGSRYAYRSVSTAELFVPNQISEKNQLTTTSGVTDFGARWNFDWIPSPRHFVKVGVATTLHEFEPETFNQVITDAFSESTENTLGQGTYRSLESVAYVEDNMAITEKWRVNAGLHFAHYAVDSTQYAALQPRISTRYKLPEGFSLTGSFTSMVQFIHLLANSGVGLPTDLWVPATGAIPPQRSLQYTAGFDKTFKKLGLELSVEGYYKDMKDLIDYQTGVNFMGNNNWQALVEKDGVGRSYGVEFFLRKTTGRFGGWIGYTLSRSERQFENINFGQVYPYKYDRRHDVSVVARWKLTKHIDLSASWVYGTGIAISFPDAVYLAPTSPAYGFWELNDGRDLDVIIDYGTRNSFRLPDYHRLDLNMRVHKKVKWGETFWNFGIYNVYNRRNPYFLFLRSDYSNGSGSPEIKARRMSLLPILPEVNFGFRF